MVDSDHSLDGINRRLREEFARLDIKSESDAAGRYGKPQQWLNRRMTGESKWDAGELPGFCKKLGLSYVYVTAGIRTIGTTPPDDHPRGTPRGGPQPVIPLDSRRDRHREPEADADALRYVAVAESRLGESNPRPIHYE
jgi:hypothetical protein